MRDTTEWLVPGWAAPTTVRAITTTCNAGNLALHTGDDPAMVELNRDRLIVRAGIDAVHWLDQVHGCHVVRAEDVPASTPATADAIWTDSPGLGCAVLTADCVPAFVCDLDGSVVGVAHGGWRGLVGGVLEGLIRALPVPPSRLIAWLGPAIGRARYEVGADVARAIEQHCGRAIADRVLTPREGTLDTPKWSADLSLLAQRQLEDLGVWVAGSAGVCTYDDTRFYSYRRDRTIGRTVSLIWLAESTGAGRKPRDEAPEGARLNRAGRSLRSLGSPRGLARESPSARHRHARDGYLGSSRKAR